MHGFRMSLLIASPLKVVNMSLLGNERPKHSKEDRVMKGRVITDKERGCISGCIFQFWGDPKRDEAPETRNEKYEKCLEDCRICG